MTSRNGMTYDISEGANCFIENHPFVVITIFKGHGENKFNDKRVVNAHVRTVNVQFVLKAVIDDGRKEE